MSLSSSAETDSFLRVAAAHLIGGHGYESLPPEALARPPLAGLFPFVAGRGRRAGMATQAEFVALCPADGLTPTDLRVRLDALTTVVRNVGEHGNAEFQRGGSGAQVSAILLWVYAGQPSEALLTAAAGMRQVVRGSTFGRWHVDCATVLLPVGLVRTAGDPASWWRTRPARELVSEWQRRGGPAAAAIGEGEAAAAQQRRQELRQLLTAAPSPATYALLVVIALFFLALELAGGSTQTRVLVRFGALVAPLVLAGQWWRLVAAAFLHIGWAHLLFNGWALYIYGPLVERLYGHARFLGLYLLAAIAGNVVSLLLAPAGISAGASGAIFGLLGATIALLWRHGRRLPPGIRRPLWQNAVAVILVNGVFGFVATGINLYAHAGGFVAGAILGALYQPRAVVTGRAQGRFGVAGSLLVTLLCALALLFDLAAAAVAIPAA